MGKEILYNRVNENRFSFMGNAKDFFKKDIWNAILKIVTLGFYSPQTKLGRLTYVLEKTQFQNESFQIKTNSSVLFKGFWKTYLLFLVVLGALVGLGFLAFTSNFVVKILSVIAFLAVLFIVAPILHYSVQYNQWQFWTKNISWKGINLSVNTTKNHYIKPLVRDYGFFMVSCLIWLFFIRFFVYMMLERYLTIPFLILFGILIMSFLFLTLLFFNRLMFTRISMIFNEMNFGNLKIKFVGNKKELLRINVFGLTLTLVTFGLGMVYYIYEKTDYLLRSVVIIQDDKEYAIQYQLPIAQTITLEIKNFIFRYLTFGLARTLSISQTLDFVSKNIILSPDLRFDKVIPLENDNKVGMLYF